MESQSRVNKELLSYITMYLIDQVLANILITIILYYYIIFMYVYLILLPKKIREGKLHLSLVV